MVNLDYDFVGLRPVGGALYRHWRWLSTRPLEQFLDGAIGHHPSRSGAIPNHHLK